MKGKLIVFSGPSGTGKGTICAELIARGGYDFSVSMTTRAPRPGELDGKSYYFVSQEVFDKTIEEGGFLEFVHKFEQSYGTPKKQILDKIESGINVLLDIEMEGALNVKSMYPEAILIFVLPPSLKVLHDRLVARHTETEEQIALRHKDIQKEIAQIGKYDYYVVNDDIKTCADVVEKIVSGTGEDNRIIDPQVFIERFREEQNAIISGN